MNRPHETISFISVIYKHSDIIVKRMIDSIDNVMQYCPFFDYEIIILNNLSDESTISKYENMSSKVKSYSHPDNLGYCGGNNFAISKSNSDYIIVINPDIIIENSLAINWMVGTSKLYNCISGRLIGTADWYTYCSSFPTDKKYKPSELPFFMDQPTLIKPGNWKAFKYIDGCFWCFPKVIWDKCQFDSNIFPGYFGENVFCFTAFLNGYSIRDCGIKDYFKHESEDKSPEQSVNVRIWSELSRKYFYEEYALKNWDKFMEYLNL